MLAIVTHFDSHLKARLSTNKYVKGLQKYVDFLCKKYHEETLLRGVISYYVEILVGQWHLLVNGCEFPLRSVVYMLAW